MIWGKKGEETAEKTASAPAGLPKEDRLEQGQILVRSVIEVLGKPEPHVKDTLKMLVGKLEESDAFTVVKTDYSKSKKIQGLFSMFVEVEFWAKNVNVLNGYCLDFMPSSIELIEPESLKLSAHSFMGFMNDFLGKLHDTDMFAKNLRQQNNVLSNNLVNLYRNIVRLILVEKPRTGAEIAAMTGINPEGIDKVLTSLEKEGMIRMQDGRWMLGTDPEKVQKAAKKKETDEEAP